ncbi:MAG TPA: hypothetical protein VHV51_20870 [Polyangiaceae bacterium]|nr:hypothetical protein [Polyangiaceae bacterium]
MDCAEIRRAFLSGAPPSAAIAGEHLRSCPHCRELFEEDALLGRKLALSAVSIPERGAAFAPLSSALAAEHGLRAFLRSRPTRTRWLTCLGLAAASLCAELARRRIPLSTLPASRLAFALLLLALFALVTHSALWPSSIERRAARLQSALALGAWCLPCMLCLAPDAHASDDLGHGFALRSFGCFAYGSALAAPSFALLWALDRSVHVSFRVLALAAGMVALLANTILILHCPVTERAHLIVGHFSIGLVWFAAVYLAERWRRRV